MHFFSNKKGFMLKWLILLVKKMNRKRRIVAIDDEKINLLLLSNILTPEYKVQVFEDFFDFFNRLSMDFPDLILLDIVMPTLSGYEAIKLLKENPKTSSVPVIFLTSKTSEIDEASGFKLGADDYITKPFSPLILKERIKRNIFLNDRQQNLIKQNEDLSNKANSSALDFDMIKDVSLGIVAQIVGARDLETGNHIVRTREYVRIIAERLSQKDRYKNILTPAYIINLSKASMLHDIGKVSVPDSILRKEGPLEENEWIIMRNHSLFGKQAIEHALDLFNQSATSQDEKELETKEFFSIAKDIAYCHHEKWDGSGYPQGLKGESIPLSARIMTVADAFDALTNKRPYKKAWSFEDSVDYLVKSKGSHYDPEVINAFLEHLEEVRDVYDQFAD